MEIVKLKINDIFPYEGNAKLHPDSQIAQIKESIMEFGNNDPIAVDENHIIIEGHGRWIALKELGYDEAECIILKGLTEDQKNAYRLVHNKLTMNSDFDIDMLNKELENISIDMAQFDFELPELNDEPFEINEDDVPEVDEEHEPTTKMGDLWKLGNHYLLCGDSTKKYDVEKLMRGGNKELIKADMVFTDPPYGVDYEGINNDSRSGLKTLLDQSFYNMKMNSKNGAPFYCFHSDKCADIFNEVYRRYCHFSSMLIWVKPSLVLSQTDYQSKHEPCLYGWFDNGTHNFYGDRKQISVVECGRENIEGHTTPKPIQFISMALKNSSKENEIILDLFGGSGSTLIACEQLGRKCRMMELDPKYCDVIVKRWETLTGNKAELMEGKKED